MSKIAICINGGDNSTSYKEGDIVDILADEAFIGTDAIKEYLFIEMDLTDKEIIDLKQEVKDVKGNIIKRRRYKIDINILGLNAANMIKLKDKNIEYQPFLSKELSALSKSCIIDKRI